jgi:hypothetical protein
VPGDEIESSPVALTALDGHVAGAPFSPVGVFSAPADPALPGTTIFYVTNAKVDCSARDAFLADRARPAALEIGVPSDAREGAFFPLPKSDLAHAAIQTSDTASASATDTNAVGRIEIVHVTKTALTLRVRAVTHDSQVEGEITLPICPN